VCRITTRSANRARGDRLDALVEPARQRLAARPAAAVAVSPLALHGRGVRRGQPVPLLLLLRRSATGPQRPRRAQKPSSPGFSWQGEVPDPQNEATIALRTVELVLAGGFPPAPRCARLYADLLAARRQWPALHDFDRHPTRLLPDAESGPVVELIRGAGRRFRTGSIQPGRQAALVAGRGTGRSENCCSARRDSVYLGSRESTVGRCGSCLPFEAVFLGPEGWRGIE